MNRSILRKIAKEHGVSVAEVRREMQDRLGFYVEEDTIILMLEDKAACVFCGNEKNLAQYSDKNICEKCLDNLHGVELEDAAI